MASDASDILEYVLWLVWTFLTLTPAALKNPVHAMILTSQDVVEKIMSVVVFAPGLLDVVQAKSPPSIAFFKGLPTHSGTLWAVYAILLEKKHCRPKLYIGSGTNKINGAHTRLLQYENRYEPMLPANIKSALDQGYTITHRGLLSWAPQPTATARFALRALFLVLECAFSILFWTMYSKTKSYGMPRQLCPWDISTLAWDGLCSHPAISEGIPGESDESLTPEQKEAKDIEMAQRWKDQRKANDAKRDPVEKRASMYTSRAKAKEEGRFTCDTCGLPFETQHLLNMHNLTQRHLDKVNGVAPKVAKNPQYQTWADENLAAKKHYCKPCDFNTSTKQKLTSHQGSQRHKKAVAEAKLKRAAAKAAAPLIDSAFEAAATVVAGSSSSSG
jgi:uncharacterized protein with PQ loop repeat